MARKKEGQELKQSYTLSLSPDTYRKLYQEAKNTNVSMSKVAENAIREKLTKK